MSCKGDLEFETECFECILPTETGDACVDLERCLREDAELVDMPHQAETFWLGADEKPTTSLECLAKGIFDFHMARISSRSGMSCNLRTAAKQSTRSNTVSISANCAQDSAGQTTGAEWWIQVRKEGYHSDLGMPFHWDKDERLMERSGDVLYPAVSTVTYLSDHGAPTVVLESCATDRGKVIEEELSRAFVSYPSVFKHLAFDGRFLHGVPEKLAKKTPASPDDAHERAVPNRVSDAERGVSTRVTLLVNIWVSHKPLGVMSLPHAIAATVSRGAQLPALTFTLPIPFTRVDLRGNEMEDEDERYPAMALEAELDGTVILKMRVPPPEVLSASRWKAIHAFVLDFGSIFFARLSSRSSVSIDGHGGAPRNEDEALDARMHPWKDEQARATSPEQCLHSATLKRSVDECLRGSRTVLDSPTRRDDPGSGTKRKSDGMHAFMKR